MLLELYDAASAAGEGSGSERSGVPVTVLEEEWDEDGACCEVGCDGASWTVGGGGVEGESSLSSGLAILSPPRV